MPERLNELFLAAAALQKKGELDAAQAIYISIQREFPQNADALHALGMLAHQRGDHHAAVGLIRHALDLNPNSFQYFADLAKVWMALGSHRLSAEASKNALRLNPNNADFALSAGLALRELGDVDASVEFGRIAVKLNPRLDVAHALVALGLALQGDPQGSRAAYQKAMQANAKRTDLHSNLIFAMEQDEAHDPKSIRAELKQFNRLHAAPLKRLIKPHPPRDASRKKIRIGWVSPDFALHVVGRCMLPVLQAFDRQRFENFCYSVVQEPDEMTAEFRQASDAWRDISMMDDEPAAELIRRDNLDVLVDLALHTSRNRLLVFARKPAPVQITYLGYPGSSGMDAMDYRISSPRLDPPGSDLSKYSEKTVMLSASYLCYRPMAAIGDISPPPSMKNGFVTFGSLNACEKITPGAVDLWCRILAAVPGSRMILFVPSEVFRNKIRDRARSLDIHPDRLEFVSFQNWQGYVETYNRIDIALDTFPRGAGITACDALWMGVPIVTLIGNSAVRRMGFSMLYDVGHTEWAAQTRERYVQIAVALASGLPRLAEIRANLRREIESSPLMDAPAVARDLERILAKISLKAR